MYVYGSNNCCHSNNVMELILHVHVPSLSCYILVYLILKLIDYK